MTSGCRRSARLASATKRSTESPAPQLASVAEAAENSTSKASNPNAATMSSPITKPTTPSSVAPIKLPMSEMHPSKAHRTTAAPSSALRNGFTDINYNTTLARTMVQTTPSKSAVPSSDFSFRSAIPSADNDLGPEARKMMEQLREEAAKIKLELTVQRDVERLEEANGRKIAQAKKKAGRYSAAHMAEFRKMDSIEGHPSAFRAAPGRSTPLKTTTPLKKGIKRSQSKANLDDHESARPKTVPARAPVRDMSADDDAHETPSKHPKRMRQRIEDDASTLRPVSRDATSIPRPKTSGNDSLRSGIPRSETLDSLMTPTKSSLARTNSLKTPTITLVDSPSQSRLPTTKFSDKVERSLHLSPLDRSVNKKGIGSFKRFAGIKTFSSENGVPSHVQTPGRFDRVQSILKRHVSPSKPASSIPQLSASTTKMSYQSSMSGKSLSLAPPATPSRKHVDFAPGTKRTSSIQELQAQSPSPVKAGIPKPASISKLPAHRFTAGTKKLTSKATNEVSATGEVKYPDLSAYVLDDDNAQTPSESVPGTFTFRSDHTISINSPSKGFGSAEGQATLRRVRDSIGTSLRLPGSFPSTSEPSSPNKENQQPILTIPHGMANKKRHRAGPDEEEEKQEPILTIPHGMTNKKRHRAGPDEEEEKQEPILTIPHGMTNKKRHRAGPDEDEEDEGAKRGMKKLRKNSLAAAEGHALVAPRLAGQTSPIKRLSPTKLARATSQTPSPQKKKTGLSLSRLNMLARPKVRK